MSPSTTAHRRLAAVLFVDFVGYSLRMQADQQLAIELLDELWQRLRDLLGDFQGLEIDTAGDGMLIEFDGALAAVQCALELQKSLAGRNRLLDPMKQILVRCSVHLGELEHRDGKIFGDGVNIAARLLPMAPPGAVVISSHVHDQVGKELDHPLLSLGSKVLKSFDRPLEVFALAGPQCREEDMAAAIGDELHDKVPRKWRFGHAELDERSMQLIVDGNTIKLERKPLEVLLFLLRHAGEVVTKDELLEAVWPGRVLSETVLNKAISRIRGVLKDSDQQIIRTQRGYGYRLSAEVKVELVGEAAKQDSVMQIGDHLPSRPHWKFVQQLGHGGHGVAWLARHEKTHEERVFKLALQAEHLSSLKREVTLSRLLQDAYPEARCFARVLDWNFETAPFFIECAYSRYGSLSDWSTKQGGYFALPLDQRIELAAQIADAVSDAHGVGVLHKDLKPSNVLIQRSDTDVISIQLTDFGSGGVLDRARLEQFGITRMGFTKTLLMDDDVAGTAMYMAPEVIAGQPATARADIYSLGVMLYQLVVGDNKKLLAPGWEREIEDQVLREDIAAAASGDPAHRLSDARELARRLRSLGQRRDQRRQQQASAAREAELQQALEHSRIRRKWVIAWSLLLGCGTLAFAWQANTARAVAEQARTHEARAEAVTTFLTNDLLSAADPFYAGRKDLTVREVLNRASDNIERRFAQRPDVASAIHLSIGKALLGLNEFEPAEQQLKLALDATNSNADSALKWAIREQLFRLKYGLGRLDQAEVDLNAMQHLATDDKKTQLRTQFFAAGFKFMRGQHSASLHELEALQPQFLEVFGLDSPETIELFGDVALIQQFLGNLDQSIANFNQVLTAIERVYGSKDTRALQQMASLGATLRVADRIQESYEVLKSGSDVAKEKLGPDHPLTVELQGNLAGTLHLLKRYEESESLYREVVKKRTAQLGAEHQSTLAHTQNLANLLMDMGQFEESQTLFSQIYQVAERRFGAEHPETVTKANKLTAVFNAQGKWEQASFWGEKTLQAGRKAFTEENWQLGSIMGNFAYSLAGLGRFDEAERLFTPALDLLQNQLGDEHRETQAVMGMRDKMAQQRLAH